MTGRPNGSTISHLKTKWIEEHHQWQKRFLIGKRYVYVWADVKDGIRVDQPDDSQLNRDAA